MYNMYSTLGVYSMYISSLAEDSVVSVLLYISQCVCGVLQEGGVCP